jgi:hypothetical protein
MPETKEKRKARKAINNCIANTIAKDINYIIDAAKLS